MQQIISGVTYCHQHMVVHRDLKVTFVSTLPVQNTITNVECIEKVYAQ